MLKLSSIFRVRPCSPSLSFKSRTNFKFATHTRTRDTHSVAAFPGSAPSPLSSPSLRTSAKLENAMAPTSETFGNFDLIKRVKLDYTDVEVSKWQSRETGLSVVHIDFEGESRLFL